MTQDTRHVTQTTSEPTPASVTDWLLDSDPAIRWQVMRDLTGAPDEDVAAERDRVAREGWGAALLAARDPDGQWMGGACFPGRGVPPADGSQPWTSTLPVMLELRALGLDPASPEAQEMTSAVAANCRWEYDDLPVLRRRGRGVHQRPHGDPGCLLRRRRGRHRQSAARGATRRRGLELRGRARRHGVVVQLDDLRARGPARARARRTRDRRDASRPRRWRGVPAGAVAVPAQEHR